MLINGGVCVGGYPHLGYIEFNTSANKFVDADGFDDISSGGGSGGGTGSRKGTGSGFFTRQYGHLAGGWVGRWVSGVFSVSVHVRLANTASAASPI